MARMTRRTSQPPRLAAWLLGRIIPADAQDSAVGDLDEEFVRDVLPRIGAARARRWYWRQTLSLARAYGIDRARPGTSSSDRSFSRNDTMAHDLRDALRTIVRSPGYSIVTIAVLALGIGATSAIFSFVDGVLLRPLPYADPERIVMVWEKPPNGLRNGVATANFLDWREQNDVFETIAAITPTSMTLSEAAGTTRLRGARVSAGYFAIFGVDAALGRAFLAEDEQPGRDRVVVLSNKIWQSAFGADRSIVGRTVTLNEQAYTVVGVLAAGSAFDRGRTDVWRPLVFGPGERARNYHWLQVNARLKPGVTIDQARMRMAPIAARIANEYPAIKKDWGITIDQFADMVVSSTLRQSLNVLMAAVGMLLLVGCANLANIAMARGTARDREVLVRAALGASRLRIVRQFLTESLLLGLTGGALGAALGYGMTRGLKLLLPPFYLPREAEIALDWRVLGFVLAVSVATALVFGVVPALQAGRIDLAGSMRGSSRAVTADRGRRRLRDGLIVIEVALACMLLVGASLLIRSFARLQQVEPARDPATLIVAPLAIPQERFASAPEALTYQRLLLERLGSVPGVREVALTSALPMQGWTDGMPLRIPSAKAGDQPVRGGGGVKMISPSYFATIGLPVVRGRGLRESDNQGSTPVIVINQAFADMYFKGIDPIGRHVLIERILPGRPELGEEVPWEIVGVAANERVGSLSANASRGLYITLDQSPQLTPNLIARTSAAAASVVPSMRAAAREFDAGQPLADVRTVEDLRDDSLAADRLRMWLVTAFSTIALVLAGIGIFGVIAYSVAQRTHEIGVRAALGASRGRLMGLVMRHAAMLTAFGLALGLAGAVGATRFMSALLFGVQPNDVVSLAGAAASLGIVAMVAAWVPARRAARVDPLVALRVE
jgi:putative ABC transport system permease protein